MAERREVFWASKLRTKGTAAATALSSPGERVLLTASNARKAGPVCSTSDAVDSMCRIPSMILMIVGVMACRILSAMSFKRSANRSNAML